MFEQILVVVSVPAVSSAIVNVYRSLLNVLNVDTLSTYIILCIVCTSVGDADLDPQDPHVFGLPDSDPLIRCTYPDLDPSLFS